nr:unnamed protein product [Callosobruchus analis]
MMFESDGFNTVGLKNALKEVNVDGWWEGVLNGEKGWFPSNYVKQLTSQQNEYKSIVLKDLVDSEKAYVEELENLVSNYLQPLDKSQILTKDQYKQLTSNIQEILELHQQLLRLVEAELRKNAKQQKFGRLFIQWAAKIQKAHLLYSSLHPRAVCILDIFKGAACPGILVLTTMLSKPFRRLDRYPGILGELERHMEIDHLDIENIQRSVDIYRNIAVVCAAIRRQKELELQVLTGPICGWEGPSLTTLGDILHMSLVAFKSRYRYLLLFPTTILILSANCALNAFVYEAKIFLTGLTVARLKECKEYKHAFEISSPITEKSTVFCQTEKDADYWVRLLSTMSTTGKASLVSEEQTVLEPQAPNQGRYGSIYGSLAACTSDYVPTYPSEDYPSAAPYAALTRYYHKMIKSKTITRLMLKQLLYSEYLNKTNLALVKIRHHKAEMCIYTKHDTCGDTLSGCDNDSYTDDSENADETVSRVYKQKSVHVNSESSSQGSDSSNPFRYIRYYNPQSDSQIEETIYVSKADLESEINSNKLPLDSTVSITLQKQCSEESQTGSEILPQKPYMACENLCMLSDDTELSSLTAPRSYLPGVRQSCPIKFVGNKFNQSSLTTIYIPGWSNSDNNISYNNIDNSVESSTHSSTLELPVNTLPIPDKMLGELLYGEFVEAASADSDGWNKTMGEPQTLDIEMNSDRISLSLKNVGFRKHNTNSDKPQRLNKMQVDSRELKKYTSSRFIQLSRPDDTEDRSRKSCFRCGSRDPSHSIRSSDSGMEGSCTLNSPDMGNIENSGWLQEDLSITGDYKNDGKIVSSETRSFEYECRCTSPFDSTPRTSAQTSIPENNFIGSRDSLTLSTSLVPSSCYSQPTNIQAVSRMGIQKSQSAGCVLEGDTIAQPEGAPALYRSGLYAHWWKKTNLPARVVKGIEMEVKKSRKEHKDQDTGKG